MSTSEVLVRAFTEEQVERLTKLSKRQLRYWDKTGFFSPEYAEEQDGRYSPYSRVYSFRDVVGLKTLGILRNIHQVPLQRLRRAAERLSHLKDELWTKTVLYVLGKGIVFREEGTEVLQDAATGQYVNGLALRAVISDVETEVQELKERPAELIGKIDRNRYVVHNAWVIAGTRVPIRAIKRFHEAGYTNDQIMEEYPDLTARDIVAALAHEDNAAA